MTSGARILPIVLRDGEPARTTLAGGAVADLWQIVDDEGGDLDGVTGTYADLAEQLARTGVERDRDGGRVVLADGGQVLPPLPVAVDLSLTATRRLQRLAAERGVTPAQLLAAFAADLTAAPGSGGSDECELATQWLHRRVWPHAPPM